MSLRSPRPTTLSVRQQLDATIEGRVITPGDAVYDQARAVEEGIVLDLRDMRRLEVDADHRTALAETGLTALTDIAAHRKR